MTGPKRQHGYTLLLTLLVLLIGGASLFVAARDPGAVERSRAAANDAIALADARRIVLARALTDANRPGSLPCAAPDTGGSGTFNGNDCDADVGRLPYRTIQSGARRDASGALLWYALDPALRDRASQEPINPADKPGALSFDGQANHAAVILAPGDALTSRASDSRAEFLEGGNESGSSFVDCADVSGCNDRAVAVSVDELFDGVQRRVVDEVADALRDLWVASDPTPSQRYLPYAAAFGDSECDSSETLGQVPTTDFDNDCGGPASVIDPATDLPAWIVDNDWLELVVYHVDPECTLAKRNCAGATLSLDGAPGLHAVVAAAGRPFSGQARPGSGVGDYLDDPDNTGGGNTTYTDQPLTLTDNDNFAGIPTP